MGDRAEARHDLVYPKHHRLGLNRPPFNFTELTPEMKCTPDRMIRDRLTEVMGCGADNVLKVKHAKLDALITWKVIGPVWLFVYSSATDQHWHEPLAAWIDQLALHGWDDEFENDHNSYRALKVEHFPGEPQRLEEAA